jgi:predicted rRNA methylase YqxC with S4 and FtsJ domains
MSDIRKDPRFARALYDPQFKTKASAKSGDGPVEQKEVTAEVKQKEQRFQNKFSEESEVESSNIEEYSDAGEVLSEEEEEQIDSTLIQEANKQLCKQFLFE